MFIFQKGADDDDDEDSLRTADSIFSSTSQTNNAKDGEETIDDTLDDIPENAELLQKFRSDKEKRVNKAAATTKNGGNGKADVRPAGSKDDEKK